MGVGDVAVFDVFEGREEGGEVRAAGDLGRGVGVGGGSGDIMFD